MWLVGSAVRSTILGPELPGDVDIAISDDAGVFASHLADLLDTGPVSSSEFGTASITYRGVRLDIAQLRTESYPGPGALPRVSPTKHILEDLARRDFTVNAIALELVGDHAGSVWDPFNGIRDYALGHIRLVAPGKYREDPLRALRAARLASRPGRRWHIVDVDEIREAGDVMHLVSGARLRAELERLLSETFFQLALRILEEHVGLAMVAEGMTYPTEVRYSVPEERRFVALLAQARGDVTGRFPLTGDEAQVLSRLALLRDLDDDNDVLSLPKVEHSDIELARQVFGASRMLDRAQLWRKACDTVTGRSVIDSFAESGLERPSGAAFGRMLHDLRAEWYWRAVRERERSLDGL